MDNKAQRALYEFYRAGAYKETMGDCTPAEAFGRIRDIIKKTLYGKNSGSPAVEGLLDGATDALIDRGFAEHVLEALKKVRP
jgi:hypothetical protein